MKNELVSCSVTSNSSQPHVLQHRAPLSMEFSRQEYWSGLPFPSPGNLPHLGVKPWSRALWVDSLLSEEPRWVNNLHLSENRLG